MAKITTIIDIGSNSVRMAIFQKTSRYGFHLIHELKSKVRISEGSYEHDSYLQPYAMDRAVNSLKEFAKVSRAFKSRKLICVATSAIRDAPNKKEFIARVYKECGIRIKVIDGMREAYFGAIACANLLHEKSGITIDIGGGSTELAYIEDREVKEAISLNLGSIRLKELFFDYGKIKEAYEYVRQYVKQHIAPILLLCQHTNFKDTITMFGIGGSIRAYAKYAMALESYMFNFLHGYELETNRVLIHLEDIVYATPQELLEKGIEESRLDSIRPGLLILQVVLQELQSQKLIISGVGVREGVFLHDMLRNNKAKIPNEINPSVRSLQDIFLISINDSKLINQHSQTLFYLLQSNFDLPICFLRDLNIAGKLYNIGANFNFYQAHKHSSYIALNSLNYGFSHRERYTIATLLEYSHKKRPKIISQSHNALLPQHDILQILSFIFSISVVLAKEKNVLFEFESNVLRIRVDSLPIRQALHEINLPKLANFEELTLEIIQQ